MPLPGQSEGLLKQIQGGANFADLAKKNSDDPAAKQGGELGFAHRGMMCGVRQRPLYSEDRRDQNREVLVRLSPCSVEERQDAQPNRSARCCHHPGTLFRQRAAAAEENYAQALTSEPSRTAWRRPPQPIILKWPHAAARRAGVISALPDSSQIIGKAFESKQGDPPQFAATGEGYAIFQVTVSKQLTRRFRQLEEPCCRRLPQ